MEDPRGPPGLQPSGREHSASNLGSTWAGLQKRRVQKQGWRQDVASDRPGFSSGSVLALAVRPGPIRLPLGGLVCVPTHKVRVTSGDVESADPGRDLWGAPVNSGSDLWELVLDEPRLAASWAQGTTPVQVQMFQCPWHRRTAELRAHVPSVFVFLILRTKPRAKLSFTKLLPSPLYF